MVLCLDIGNTQIYGGVFKGKTLKLQFRKHSKMVSSDEYGLFLKSVLRENGIPSKEISQISLCSVVPEAIYPITQACENYFNIQPFYLKPGIRTGLKIKYQNPLEVGADRIANAMAAVEKFENQNIIIIDFGTAITICAINEIKEYLGGVILPGLSISMKALELGTAKLPSVEILPPPFVLGRSTIESIQSGLFNGTEGALIHILKKLKKEIFNEAPSVTIGTGGFANLFTNKNLFEIEIKDLVLRGLLLALEKNQRLETPQLQKKSTQPKLINHLNFSKK